MESKQIVQVDGELPIYGEMKPVPVTLETCLLSNDDDFPYGQAQQGLATRENCGDGELSAAEINSMIMINEGPNALSSVQEEFESSNVNLNPRTTSVIKILTSDLPKGGRFLSTKSLQKLSGTNTVIRRNPKFEMENEDEVSEGKVKAMFTKQNKSVKENLEKSSQSKILEHEIPKKNVKVEKLKMKSLKKKNSLEKLSSKKKSLKTFKKIGVKKNKDLNSATKAFEKKVLENNGLVKKEGILKDSELVMDKTIVKAGSVKKKSKTESEVQILISRSGRLRKFKEVSKDFVLPKNKEDKVVISPADREKPTLPVTNESEATVDNSEQPEPEEDPKLDVREHKSRGDLLQSALSESVKSWFDIAAGVEKKGRRTRGKVKIIPRDSDTCFEETSESEKECKVKSVTTTEESGGSDSQLEAPKEESVGAADTEKSTTKNEEETDLSQSSDKASSAGTEREEPATVDADDQTPKDEETEVEETMFEETKAENTELEETKVEEHKKRAAVNGKKNKAGSRQVLGYKKKRRKPRNVTVSSYLKNYGEKIDFDVKLDQECETKKGVTPKGDVGASKPTKKELEKEEKKEEVTPKSPEVSERSFKTVIVSPSKKPQKAENLKVSLESKTGDPEKSPELPASLPSEENKADSNEKDEPLKEKAEEECKSDRLAIESEEALSEDTGKRRRRQKKASEKDTLGPSEETKVSETVEDKKKTRKASEKEAPSLSEEMKVSETVEDKKKTKKTSEKETLSLSEEMKVSETVEDKKKTKKASEKETPSPSEEMKVSEAIEDGKSKEKQLRNEILKIRNKIHQQRRKNLYNTKVFGMKNKRKLQYRAKKGKRNSFQKVPIDKTGTTQNEEEPKKAKVVESSNESKKMESEATEKGPEAPDEKSISEVADSFSASPASSIPFKKRPRRMKASEGSEEAGKEVKEEVNSSERQDCERRKSHREIKLTPKIVDMIATSFSHKRFRKTSTSKDEELSAVKEDSESSNSGKKSGGGLESKGSAKDVSSDQPLAAVPFVENYLQSKMEANASNFESSWEPGDLVWARFAGNPFWPALILRDPFSNDEYSRVKYLGRLPRPFVHVQFLADYGRRAWGPELYIMNFNGLEEFEKLKSSLPEVNAFTQRKDLMYQQAFFTPKKMEKNWIVAVKEGETLINKSKDERITYMKIKYPLVKYAASVANGRLVPNERTKFGDLKSPLLKNRKRKSLTFIPDESSSDWSSKKNDEMLTKDTFECVNTSDLDEGAKKSEKESPKITLKLVRSPRKGSKRKPSKMGEEGDEKKIKKRIRKEALDDDYVPSDSGSNGEKGSESASNKQKKYLLFKGARTEKVCQICFEILENEKTVKCKGACQGLFHKSCADKMSADLPPVGEDLTKGVKNKRRKKLFADTESESLTDAQAKESADKEWRCIDCLRGENPCFVCSSRSGNRQRCCVAYCGKFYHQKCLKLYPQTIYNQGAPIRKSQFLQQKKTADSESPHYQILSCPLHVCHTCASDNPADFNMKYLCEKLVKCIKCPSAYHGGNYCVPAGSTILNTSQIICAKHGDPGKKSHVNISWCFICNMGGSLICCEWCPSSFHLDCLNIKPPDGPYICEECESGRFPLYGEVVWVKLGRYRWWPAKVLFPQEILPNIMALPHKPWEFAVRFYGSNDHYWLNRGRVFLYQEGDSEQKFKGQSHVDKIYQRAVQEATKDYFALQEERKSRLLGTNNSGVMKPPPYVKIKTNKAVGKVQLGNVSQSEPQTCDCDPNAEAPCSPGSDCLNRMLLVECNPNYCRAGTRCWNQSFEKREYPPLEPYRTERRGWGLRSSMDIPKGSFVIEYVGEVVDDEEFKRRMKRKQETKDSNYYFLTIDKDRMIDAGPKGNLARFMNHSCSPNCETQKWTVNGDTRVGLFALRDIPAGTELTFNYNLDCIGNEKKACHCEEENCSGFIGVKAKNDKSEALKNKMVKRLEKESEDECYVCGDGGELMVCDVSNCPKVYHMECVNLTEWPNELWLCPRHRCCLCTRTTKRCCKLCPTAYCFAHLDNNMFPDNQGGLLCSKHSTCAVKPAQILRKASYVNRNTPVVEYEKPFAEKYRPPPPKERTSPEEKKEEILMEPNLTDNTPIMVENPLLSSATPTRLSDGVSVQVLYVDEEGQIVSVDESTTPSTGEAINTVSEKDEVPKPIKRKKRTNIPRKKLNPPAAAEETGNKAKSPAPGGINFESLMIKSVEDKILDSKLNMDNIYNIIGGGGGGEDTGHSETDSAERCVRDDGNDLKAEAVSKKEEAEVDRSRRSKYFKIITPEKFIKVAESEANQKKVTDFNYIEFMHPLRSAKSKSKTDENTRKL